ncbi:hypothetical protein RJ640_014147 [Escallonia rubra]|uniref:Uncharacterized protein n=1 Tax=Escallonia rubra TaxID=112253 RepID=A0AA88RH13_9ASTE|nr:hypothetical protein RJ640_014147 [Escallonia rubra]
MPRHNRVMELEGLIPEYGKIRKRGCSSSSSTSSKLHNYRFKRAILVGKAQARGGSRSSTPAARRGAAESPRQAQSRGGGVSARKLAATLWGMNEMSSPSVRERLEEKRMASRREKVRSVHSGSLPPHLSDPSHSPVSERMDRSGTGSHYQRRTSLISQRLRLPEHNVGVFDSQSSASLMEIETRSRAETQSGCVAGSRSRLKDVSNALTTSKELLKIINRIWAHNDPPSSSMSLISALHAELERARLQVNQLIKEQRSEKDEISCLLKCFAEEKAAWKSKEHAVVEAAIESISGELEVERKLRRRFESLNKKLGSELAETKASFMKAVKELQSEKRAREIMEQVCDELASDIGEDRAHVEELKRESAKVHEEVERERDMLQVADKLREERVQMKLSEAKHHFEEKNGVVDKLRNQLEAFLRPKKGKKKGCGSLNLGNDEEIAKYLSKKGFGSQRNDEKEDDGEVEDDVECEEDSAESDLHSIELNMEDNNNKFKWAHASVAGGNSRNVPIDDDMKGRIPVPGKVPRKNTSLLRSISDGVEWGTETESFQNLGGGLDQERFRELEKQAQRKSDGDEMQRYKSVKGLRDHILSSSRIRSARDSPSPIRQWGQPWPSRDPGNVVQERSCIVQGSGLKSRLGEARGEGHNARRSKR